MQSLCLLVLLHSFLMNYALVVTKKFPSVEELSMVLKELFPVLMKMHMTRIRVCMF